MNQDSSASQDPAIRDALARLNPDFLQFWRPIDDALEDDRHYLFASDEGIGLVIWIGYRSGDDFIILPTAHQLDEDHSDLIPLLYAPIPGRAVDELRTIEHMTCSKEEQSALEARDLLLLASATAPRRERRVVSNCGNCGGPILHPSRNDELCEECLEELRHDTSN